MGKTHQQLARRAVPVPAAEPAEPEVIPSAPAAVLAPVLPGRVVVGSASDPAEAHADAVAHRAVLALRGVAVPRFGLSSGVGGSAGVVHRSGDPGAHGPIGHDGGVADASDTDALARLRGGGAPLPADLRRTMESAMGADLGAVRVHTGSAAAGLNDRFGAKAFTIGQDVVFRDGVPDTSTADGQFLLAHELGHAVTATPPAQHVRRKLSALAGKSWGFNDIKRFESGEVISRASGIDSETGAFVHEGESIELDNDLGAPQLSCDGRAFGEVQPLWSPQEASKAAVKMHLVNSNLAPEANTWAENWVWGLGSLNSDHFTLAESGAISALRKSVTATEAAHVAGGDPNTAASHGIQFKTEATRNATVITRAAMFEHLVDEVMFHVKRGRYVFCYDDWAPVQDRALIAQLLQTHAKVGGAPFASYLDQWTAAVAATMAGQVTVWSRSVSSDSTGKLTSAEPDPVPVVIKSERTVQPRVRIDTEALNASLIGLGGANPHGGRPVRNRRATTSAQDDENVSSAQTGSAGGSYGPVKKKASTKGQRSHPYGKPAGKG